MPPKTLLCWPGRREAHGAVVQWQNFCFPSRQRGFDSRQPLQLSLPELDQTIHRQVRPTNLLERLRVRLSVTNSSGGAHSSDFASHWRRNASHALRPPLRSRVVELTARSAAMTATGMTGPFTGTGTELTAAFSNDQCLLASERELGSLIGASRPRTAATFQPLVAVRAYLRARVANASRSSGGSMTSTGTSNRPRAAASEPHDQDPAVRMHRPSSRASA